MPIKCRVMKESANFLGAKALTIPILQSQVALTQLCNTTTKAVINSPSQISIPLLPSWINPSYCLKKVEIDYRASQRKWLIKRQTTRIT